MKNKPCVILALFLSRSTTSQLLGVSGGPPSPTLRLNVTASGIGSSRVTSIPVPRHTGGAIALPLPAPGATQHTTTHSPSPLHNFTGTTNPGQQRWYKTAFSPLAWNRKFYYEESMQLLVQDSEVFVRVGEYAWNRKFYYEESMQLLVQDSKVFVRVGEYGTVGLPNHH
ncbi:UNVERIFIED_CONTAM: hypothetical protein FKN15_065481 [Acipenser sinensis]